MENTTITTKSCLLYPFGLQRSSKMVYSPLGSAPVAIAIRKSLHLVCFHYIMKHAKTSKKCMKNALADFKYNIFHFPNPFGSGTHRNPTGQHSLCIFVIQRKYMKYIKFLASTDFKIYTFLSKNLLGSRLYRIGVVFCSLCISLEQQKYTKKRGKCLGADLKIYEFPTMMPSGPAHRAAHMYVHRPRPWYITDVINRNR